MLCTYAVIMSLFMNIGGLSCLGLGYCWLSHRLVNTFSGALSRAQAPTFCFLQFVRGYVVFLLPWALVLSSQRTLLGFCGDGFGAINVQLPLIFSQLGAA